MKKKIFIMGMALTMMFSSVTVSAATEYHGYVTRSGQWPFDGHWVKTSFDWVVSAKNNMKSSDAYQTKSGGFATPKGVTRKKAEKDEHVWDCKSKFTIQYETPLGNVKFYDRTYIDRVHLKGNGKHDVDWDI